MDRITVDFTKHAGPVRPLHGVNSGPRTYCFYRNESDAFRDAGIPLCRLHDTEYPYGSGAFVDIPCIFRNFDADADDPASYDFSQTDAYIQAILDVGAKPLYRLGVSIEHSPVPRNIFAPKDPVKWAAICEHIIAHYNEGWAGGMKAGIEYWEIWNEPESQKMWIGTREQFFELYAVTAKRLKARFPDIKIGGYASCGFYGISVVIPEGQEPTEDQKRRRRLVDYAEAFMAMCRDQKLPLDFFSWHIYGTDPDVYAAHARYVRELLDRYGYEKTENVLDEWNLGGGAVLFAKMPTPEGAAHAAAVMCSLQAAGIHAATYYDAQPAMPYCGIFYQNTGGVTPTYYPFKYWNALYRAGTAAETAAEGERLYAAAACGADGKKYVLVSHYAPSDTLLFLDLTLDADARYTVRAVDAAHTDGVIASGRVRAGNPRIRWIATGWSAFLVELEAVPQA